MTSGSRWGGVEINLLHWSRYRVLRDMAWWAAMEELDMTIWEETGGKALVVVSPCYQNRPPAGPNHNNGQTKEAKKGKAEPWARCREAITEAEKTKANAKAVEYKSTALRDAWIQTSEEVLKLPLIWSTSGGDSLLNKTVWLPTKKRSQRKKQCIYDTRSSGPSRAPEPRGVKFGFSLLIPSFPLIEFNLSSVWSKASNLFDLFCHQPSLCNSR